MEVINIPHATKNSQLTFARTANAEFVNPIENLMNNLIDLHKAFTVNSFRFAHKHNNPSPIGIMSMNDILTRLEWKGLEYWKKEYDRIMLTELPDSIFKILNCNDKDIQRKIFKPPFELSRSSLQKFIIKAWQIHGFKYSEYSFEHPQKEMNPQELPPGFFLNNNGDIETFGSTFLKEGELKNAIRHRKVTRAKFLDNDSEWHCFYYTNNDINGKELYKQSHIHYISNNWTIERNVVLKELRKRHRAFTSSVHIDYKRN